MLQKALDALKVARECMIERRGCADAGEWKYGDTWDAEDIYISDVIETIEAQLVQNT